MTHENVGGLWNCFKGTVIINLIIQSIMFARIIGRSKVHKNHEKINKTSTI